MKALQVAGIVGAIALTGIYLAAGNSPVETPPEAAPEPAATERTTSHDVL